MAKAEKQSKRKVCLVTGASRGIGRATALALAKQGFAVAVNYQASRDQAEEVCSAIRAIGGQSMAVQANVIYEDEVIRMVETIRDKLGPPSILINNAGITRDKSFIKMTRLMWEEVLGVNLTGPFTVTQVLLPG